MNVLVIGGTRFFGLDTVRLLTRRGHRVTVLSRRALDPTLAGEVHAIQAHRGDRAALDRAFAAGPHDVVLDNVAFTAADVMDTLSAGRGRFGHYLMVSTGSIYVDPPTDRAIVEDDDHLDRPDPVGDELGPRYSRGKREAERVLHTAPSWSVVRPTIVFGPRDPTHRLAWYTARALAGYPLPASTFRFNPIFSRDLAVLLVTAVERPSPGRAFNAAGGDTLTPADLAALARNAAAALPAPLVPPKPPGADDAPPLPATGFHVYAIDRARAELGFDPTPAARWMEFCIT